MSDLHDKARELCNDSVICPGCTHQFVAIPVNVQARIAALLAENERLSTRVQHTQQWYAERWQWMQHWFRTTGKDLPIANQFWSIIANGTPDVNTPPTYQQQLNIALHRAEAAEARLRELASAEPVAYEVLRFRQTELVYAGWYEQTANQVPFGAIPLIRRPEMQK